MSGRSIRLAIAVTALALFAALAGGASANAATVVNGGFETGTFEGWTVVDSSPEVGWFIEENVPPLPAPFSGMFFAITEQQRPGTSILYQDIALEPNATHHLQLAFGYESEAPITVPVPDTLTATETSPANQQVRIDVMKPTAPLDSVAPSDILASVFASSESENLEGEESEPFVEPKPLTADLSQFAGQTVRLRIAVAHTRDPLYAAVDNVAVTSTPLPAPIVPPTPAPPAPAPPSNLFTKGKVTLNKKNGTATLAVSVPGAGTLTAIDAHSKVATASLARTTTKPKTKPVYVKSATVTSTGAGVVKVPIVPTAAAKKILVQKGKLAVSVKLTFAPTGGSAATQGYSGKLLKTLKPAPI